MNSYTTSRFSSTIGTVALFALLSASPAPAKYEPHPEIKTQMASSTFDQHRNPITGDFLYIQNPIDLTLAKAYESLLIQSMSPDYEIEAIISKNLWSLYEE